MAKRKFTMPFEPMTIEHLGLRLYSTLPPVLSELVSNAFDAESPKAEVSLPAGAITATSEVIVRDYGHGMAADELQDEYLPIGRNRRGEDSKKVKSKNGKRYVTGRKGLGKLSSFGIAEEMELRTVSGGEAWCLRLNYREMQAWAKDHPKDDYEPTIVQSRTGKTSDPDGCEVRLRKLRRKNKIDIDIVRHGVAQRLDVIGPKFKVEINGKEIAKGDRNRKGDCVRGLVWDFSETPGGDTLGTGEQMRGWIGFVAGAKSTGRGVDIFAHGKAAELGSFFNLSSTHAGYARAYVVGEVNADFLDQDEDLVSTARNSVVWEHPTAQVLQVWGQELLKWAFDRWVEARRMEKEETITKEAGFDKWLATRSSQEQAAAKKMLKLLVDDVSVEPGSAKPMLEIIKSSVETVAFRDLIEAMEEKATSAAMLLRLFDDWRLIEAREHLRVADGRQSATDQLEDFIDNGALEVSQLQPLLSKNLWLLNPRWTEADEQVTYTKLLRTHCKEPKGTDEKDLRLDILGVTIGARLLTVVELKRPEKTLSRDDLEQIEKYVDWAQSNICGTSNNSPTHAEGLLVVGNIGNSAQVKQKLQRLAASNIRVETFRGLHAAARREYKEIEQHLEKIAPEYARSKRKKKS
ncbi:MAG: ATP-binding protein [Gemmatimonadaceae bacterium]